MIKEEKCVEYFFDSKKYSKEQIIECMKKEEVGFEKKKAEIIIELNKYGIYEVKLRFSNNKINFIKKREKKEKIKFKKNTYKGYETYKSNNKIYGQYKATKTYQPI